MQIFIRSEQNGRTRTLEVESSDLIVEVKQRFIDKVEVEEGYSIPSERIRFRYGGKVLEDNDTIGQWNIQKESTIMFITLLGNPFPPTYDAGVKPILMQDLTNLGQVHEAQFVFIGLGSYDNGHDEGISSVKRQQCPDAVLEICRQKGWKLRVILVDRAFTASPLSGAPQIYNVDANWQWKEELDQEEGKVRHFTYKDHDFQLCTYATNIYKAEYNGTVKTIAGVTLSQLAEEIVNHGGCIVVGNFFKISAKPHLALGDVLELQKLGYLS